MFIQDLHSEGLIFASEVAMSRPHLTSYIFLPVSQDTIFTKCKNFDIEVDVKFLTLKLTSKPNLDISNIILKTKLELLVIDTTF